VTQSEGTFYTFGLIGEDVAKSLSPRIHTLAMERAGVRGTYVAYSTERDEFKETLMRLRDSQISGLNITIPFKERVMDLLDELSPDARDIGAVNTVKIEGQTMTGYNTDAEGFLKALEDGKGEVRGKRALVLGSGGAARAVCHALLRRGAGALTIASRNAASAILIARSPAFLAFSIPVRVIPLVFGPVQEAAREADLIVNATPLGSVRFPKVSPLPGDNALHPGQFVMDLVYSPPRTMLLSQAERAGAHALNGMSMLVHQALASLEIWLGIDVDAKYVLERL
jgi:shikimate dehydrogenase